MTKNVKIAADLQTSKLQITTSAFELTFQKYFSSRYWTNFFPPNQDFVFSVAHSLRSQKLPINCIFTVYKSLISYCFMFLVPCIGNLKYVFVGFSVKPAAGEKFCEFCMPKTVWEQFRYGDQFRRLFDDAVKIGILHNY